VNLKAALLHLLPKAIAWAETEAARAADAGRSLVAGEIRLARRVGVAQPERVRLAPVDSMPMPEDPALREAALQIGLLGPAMAGLTLGHAIFIRRGRETRRLLSHELRHVHQYEQAGSIADFLPDYLQQIVEFGYAAAPLEQDAREHEVADQEPDVPRNPWLDIPLTDYEGHMTSPAIGQARLLSDIFAEVLSAYSPESVAVLGCAGGNGFERIVPETTRRLVGIDLNPDYLEQARVRFQRRIPGLELHAGDLQTTDFTFAPVALVFAALVFEYVDAAEILPRIRRMLRRDSLLVTVVQLASDELPEISPSSYPSLESR
jgi:SAM-dependent methyltransferase